MTSQLNKENLPQHIAIIMDGNGRWARAKNRPRLFGHNAGMKTLKKIVRAS
jgi:undecaprenyl diphosphate synthase